LSTILRALQRLEKEKGGDLEMSGLGEGLAPGGEPPVREGGARWRIGIAVFLVLLLGGFFLRWLLSTEEVGQPSAESPPAIAAAPQPPSESLTRPPRRPPSQPEAQIAAARPGAPAEQIGVSPPAQPVAAPPPLPLIEEPASWVPVAQAPPAAKPPPPAAEPVIQPPPRIAESPALREPVAAAPPPPPIEEPALWVPVAQAQPAANPPPPAAEPAIQPPPPIARPPAAKPPAPARVATVRPPKVTVRKTIWHPTPERRVAEIEVEGRKGPLELREGDAVGTLVVSEIQPSGVVFLHGGEELHQKVGSGR